LDDRIAYIDSSAFVKLVLPAPESEAMRAEAEGWRLVSSTLLEVEAVLAVRRRAPLEVVGVREVLRTVELVEMDRPVRFHAGDLPGRLRALDAIHLATALSLGDRCETFFCYDDRLAAAARGQGLAVSVPAP
jgi:uncharacterized protein